MQLIINWIHMPWQTVETCSLISSAMSVAVVLGSTDVVVAGSTDVVVAGSTNVVVAGSTEAVAGTTAAVVAGSIAAAAAASPSSEGGPGGSCQHGTCRGLHATYTANLQQHSR